MAPGVLWDNEMTQCRKQWDAERQEAAQRDREQQKSLVTVVSNTVNQVLPQRMERIVRNEVKLHLQPAVAAAVSAAMQSDVVPVVQRDIKSQLTQVSWSDGCVFFYLSFSLCVCVYIYIYVCVLSVVSE